VQNTLNRAHLPPHPTSIVESITTGIMYRALRWGPIAAPPRIERGK
jgi:hypothetical protein